MFIQGIALYTVLVSNVVIYAFRHLCNFAVHRCQIVLPEKRDMIKKKMQIWTKYETHVKMNIYTLNMLNKVLIGHPLYLYFAKNMKNISLKLCI